MTATADLSSPSVAASHNMVIWKAFKEQKTEKRDLKIGGAAYQKYYMPIISSYPNLWGVCVMTFLYISNRLAVKHKKYSWPLDCATYQKYYRPTLSSYPNFWGVGIMTFAISLTV